MATTVHALHYGKSRKPLARVSPDNRYPAMWRIHWPDGSVSDMVNLARAMDAAMVLCRSKHPKLPHDDLLHWKQDPGQSVVEAGYSDLNGDPVPDTGSGPESPHADPLAA